ncbi:MAG TPA: hypothetical protein PK109_01600 [Candidatus Paceibacterota bacterium]|nr:hypothetical protein [Candidatus Paceibacterota bacterium]
MSSILYRLIFLTSVFLLQSEWCRWCYTDDFGGASRPYALAVAVGAFSLLVIRTTWTLRIAALGGALWYAFEVTDNLFGYSIAIGILGLLPLLTMHIVTSAHNAGMASDSYDFGRFLGRIIRNTQRGRAWGQLQFDVTFALGCGGAVLTTFVPELSGLQVPAAALTFTTFVLAAPLPGRGPVVAVLALMLWRELYAVAAWAANAVAATVVLTVQLAFAYAPHKVRRIAQRTHVMTVRLGRAYRKMNEEPGALRYT